MVNTHRNEYVAEEQLQVTGLGVQNLENRMQQFKEEVAAEIGLIGYNSMDKGNLTARQNGYVGGNMTKKLVAFAQHILAGGNASNFNMQSVIEIPPEIRQLNDMASQNFEQFAIALQSGSFENNQLQTRLH